VDAAILGLADAPRPLGHRKLQGKEGFLRIRVGSYRVVYQVEDEVLVVVVVRIGHSREIYREISRL
jgi:mRNA interferase RelE/StbE